MHTSEPATGEGGTPSHRQQAHELRNSTEESAHQLWHDASRIVDPVGQSEPVELHPMTEPTWRPPTPDDILERLIDPDTLLFVERQSMGPIADMIDAQREEWLAEHGPDAAAMVAGGSEWEVVWAARSREQAEHWAERFSGAPTSASLRKIRA